MSKILFNEINPGFTTLIVSLASYLEKPEVKAIYNAPFEIFCWFWFLAYVINFKRRHNRKAFLKIPKYYLFKTLKSNVLRFVDVVDQFCARFFTRQLFQINYNVAKGFYLTTKTTLWNQLIHSLTGHCYGMPASVVDALDAMGCHYFHDNGLLVGPIALINHQCDCGVSYGFDWQRAKTKKSRIAINNTTTVVPVYLSWDRARVLPKTEKILVIGSEIVVKYFEPNDYLTFVNLNTWFGGDCECNNCTTFRATHPRELYQETVNQCDVSSQMVNINLQESYDGTGRILKDRKRKAVKKTKSLYTKWPKIEPEIKKSRPALENYVYVNDPWDEWCGQLLRQVSAQKEGGKRYMIKVKNINQLKLHTPLLMLK